MADLVGRTIDSYRMDRLITQGSMAAVYQATDTRTQAKVAFKVMHPYMASEETFQQQFLRQAAALKTLDHPSIVNVTDYGFKEGHLFLVMEFVTGGSLHERLRVLRKESKAMDWAEAIDFARQLADALHYAHQQGVIHYAVKPTNVMLKPNGKTRSALADFGLSRLADSVASSVVEQSLGGLAYSSPEQCSAEKVDARSDIYSLGIVLFEMATGQVPYDPRSVTEAVRMHTQDAIPNPNAKRPGFPAALEKIITRALSKDPNNRFQTASEMSRALQKAAQELFAPAEPEPEAPATQLETPPPPPPAPKPAPAAPPPGPPQDQVVISAPGKPNKTIKANKSSLTIGREADNDIILDSPDKKISRNHARIDRAANGNFTITDLGSGNGTYLDEKRIPANTPQPWTLGKPLRINDYKLTVERTFGAAAAAAPPPPTEYKTGLGEEYTPPPPVAATPPAPKPKVAPPPAPAAAPPPRQAAPVQQPVTGLDEPVAPRETAPAAPMPAPQSEVLNEKIGVTLQNSGVAVVPGQRASLVIEILNQSNLVDHFTVTVINLPADWYSVPDKTYLMPGKRGAPTVIFHPPLTSNSTAGNHPFEIRVSTETQAGYALAKGSLQVGPFYSFTTELRPQKLKGKGKAELIITNTGNTTNTYVLEAYDREQSLNYDLGSPNVNLAPGQTERHPIQVTPKTRPVVGNNVTNQFEVKVTSTDQSRLSQVKNGELVFRPIIPTTAIAAAVTAVTVAVATVGLIARQLNLDDAARLAAQVVAQNTAVATSAIATEVSDPDGDELTTAEEAALSKPGLVLDPNNPDTDGDGLLDGQETDKNGQRPFKTDPLNPDTDGDGLTDGYEVNESCGTDPSTVDFDGDGVNDGDENEIDPTLPCLVPTSPPPTPTATPTPSPNDCSGSPVSRLIGLERARVMPGGVDQRLRTEPYDRPDGGKNIGEVIMMVPMGREFAFIPGVAPVCADLNESRKAIRWWNIEYNGTEGWIAEGIVDKGTDEDYFLGPLVPGGAPTVQP